MSEADVPAAATEQAQLLESALAETQRLEREEREADLARQHSADERIVQALSENTAPGTRPE